MPLAPPFAEPVKPTFEHMEKSSAAEDDVHDDQSVGHLSLTVADEAALRKSLLRKLDTRILPVLALLFLFSFL